MVAARRPRQARPPAVAALAMLLVLAADAGPAVAAPSGICPSDAPQHTGLLAAGPGVEYFYWLAESRSETPSADPLVLWMTGGPGCSSALAALTENGPCQVAGREDGGGFVMRKREASWTEAANVIWVDQPAGVGFSTRPAVAGLAHNESQVAEAMFGFLRSFYTRYPLLQKVPLYIFGESYAGHYVPAVAARVLEEGGGQHGMHLAGVGIGNGLVNPAEQFKSKPAMAKDGGLGGSLGKDPVSEPVYEQMARALPKCIGGIRDCEATDERDQRVCLNAYMGCMMTEMVPVLQSGLNPYDMRKECVAGSSLCYDFSLETELMNDPAMQRLLGAPRLEEWSACNMTVTNQFVASGDYLRDLSPEVARLLAAGVGVLAYSGDDDFMVDWLGTKEWMAALQWPHRRAWASAPDREFRPAGGPPAGRVKTARGLTFVQVYNAGHLVPMDQPQVALDMVREFLRPDSPWRPTVKSRGAAALSSQVPETAGAAAAMPATLATPAAFAATAALLAASAGLWAAATGKASAAQANTGDESARYVIMD